MTDKVEKYQEMMDLFRLYFNFSKRFYGEEVKFSQLTPQQGRTLMYIQAHPGMIQRELADNFHLRNASVTNMLKNLERDGYIQRKQDEKSARIKRIYITQLGDQLIPLLKELNQQVRNN